MQAHGKLMGIVCGWLMIATAEGSAFTPNEEPSPQPATKRDSVTFRFSKSNSAKDVRTGLSSSLGSKFASRSSTKRVSNNVLALTDSDLKLLSQIVGKRISFKKMKSSGLTCEELAAKFEMAVVLFEHAKSERQLIP